MKTGIHPKYNPKATVTCNSCKTTFQAGSTSDNVFVEVCSHCHPFYTGQSGQLVDTDNVIERFRKRSEAADVNKVVKKRKKVQSRKGSVVSEVSAAPKVTLKDMLKQLQ